MQKVLSDDRWGLRIGLRRFVIEAPSQSEAFEFVESRTDAIALALNNWGFRECLVTYPKCDRPLRIPVSMAKNNIYEEKTMLNGLVSEQWLRVAEEIHNESRPAFLVSINEHRNLLVNDAACKLMDCDAQTLLSRHLAQFWTLPGQVKPISYTVALPPNLQEFIKLLKQQSELINHTFCNWKPAGDDNDAYWTEWNDDIKYREIMGHPCRLMIVNGSREVKV